jgi:hypothetical protein
VVYSALSFLANELDNYLKRVFHAPLSETKAILSSHVSLSGAPATNILNKVSVTLVNLEPEATLRNLHPPSSGGMPRLNPTLSLNLSVLFAANFDDYEESLKFVDGILSYFQSKTLFNPQNSPAMPAGIDRLVAELETTTYQQWSYLWGMLGTKCVPGVIYKIRVVTIQEGAIQGSNPAIAGLGINS